mmetsp:Transcript_105743/g.203258  ORF Transcript_105743/g.203258 Transcript_105743/m.203258 type:complete len:292 (-) Transcript_105743:91-966(-)
MENSTWRFQTLTITLCTLPKCPGALVSVRNCPEHSKLCSARKLPVLVFDEVQQIHGGVRDQGKAVLIAAVKVTCMADGESSRLRGLLVAQQCRQVGHAISSHCQSILARPICSIAESSQGKRRIVQYVIRIVTCQKCYQPGHGVFRAGEDALVGAELVFARSPYCFQSAYLDVLSFVPHAAHNDRPIGVFENFGQRRHRFSDWRQAGSQELFFLPSSANPIALLLLPPPPLLFFRFSFCQLHSLTFFFSLPLRLLCNSSLLLFLQSFPLRRFYPLFLSLLHAECSSSNLIN